MVIVRGLYRKEVAGSSRSSYGHGICLGSACGDAAMRSASCSSARVESAHETRQLKHTCSMLIQEVAHVDPKRFWYSHRVLTASAG